MIGPPGSPYANGVFQVTIKFGNNYPTTKPTVKFVTKIYHLNIKQGGTDKIGGLSALESWINTMTISKLLTALDELLVKPNPRCGASNDLMAQYYANETTYD
jgi:ubiquitin-protein ligase